MSYHLPNGHATQLRAKVRSTSCTRRTLRSEGTPSLTLSVT